MSEQTGNALLLALMLVLPLSALVARRLPIGRVAMLALAWVGVFAAGLVIVALVSRADWLTSGARDVFYGRDQSVTGDEVRIPMGEDGHFHARVAINGVERTLLVDSGATDTAVSMATAMATRIDPDGDGLVAQIDTANGTVLARRTKIASLTIGSISASDLPVVVAPEFGDTDVLGMSFLSRLKSWRVEGRELVLTPNPI